MRVWVTQYALSGGIILLDTEVQNGRARNNRGGMSWITFAIGKDAFLTEAEAKADAEARRLKKMASLRKQLAALEKKVF